MESTDQQDPTIGAAAPAPAASQFADPPEETTGGEAPPTPAPEGASYFDWRLHEKVQQLHKRGVRTDLGERWGGLLVRLRPFTVHACIVRREATEQAIRVQLGLGDEDPIPAEKNIEINRATVTMAITGGEGRILASESMIAVADARGFKRAGDIVELSGQEEAEHVREFFAPMLVESMPFLTTLVRAARQLQRVKDEEIGRLGEGFVFGRHVKLDWAD